MVVDYDLWLSCLLYQGWLDVTNHTLLSCTKTKVTFQIAWIKAIAGLIKGGDVILLLLLKFALEILSWDWTKLGCKMSQCTNNIICLLQPQCASLRVHDCSRLMHEAGRDAVLRDEVCAAQCSNILLSSPGPSLEALEDIVSLTTRKPSVRARDFLPTNLIPPPLSIRRPSLRSFKLSDIFLGQWNVTRVSKIWQPCFLKLS